MNWSERITAAWNKSRDGILEVGQLLIEAKATLGHGEWMAMIDSDLPFKKSTAEMLMKIARDRRLANSQYAGNLPNSWGTLYELTKLDDEAFKKAIETGTIRSDMERKDIAPLLARPVIAEPEVFEDDDRQLMNLQRAWKAAGKRVRKFFLKWIQREDHEVFGLGKQ